MSDTQGEQLSASEIGQTPEARDSRATVVNAFSSAYSLLEQTPDENLTPQEIWVKKSIKKAKEETLDKNKNTFTNEFENHETGETFSQEEGIPVEELLVFLSKKLNSLPSDSPERQNIINCGHVLFRNSRRFDQFPHRMEPSRLLRRVEREAYFISRDERATHDPRSDWFKAQDTITRRRELIIPPERPATSEPTITTEPEESPKTGPAIWRNKDSDTPVTVTGYLGEGPDGRTYVSVEGSQTGIPLDEITFLPETSEPEAPGPSEPEEVITTPSSEEPSEPEPDSVEQIRREFVIINRTVDIRKRAAELAEEQLRAEMRRGSAFNPLNWPRKIGLRIMEPMHRQRYIERASQAMLEHNNSYLTMDVVRNAAVDATHRIAEEREAGKAKIEQVKLGRTFAEEQVIEAQGELREMMIGEIIRPIVEEQLTDSAQIQQRLREFVQTHQEDQQVQAIFGRDATQYGRLAEYFASDLLETGALVRQDLEAHRYALEQLNEIVQIKLANTHWAAETQANFNAVDRAVAWAQSHRLTGFIANPAFIGAAASLTTFGAMRVAGAGGQVAQVAVPVAGLLPGAAFAAIRRNYDLKVDRASHQVERTYNRQIPQGARRREALERFTYNTASVNELINGGGQESPGQDRRSLSELLAQDLSEVQITNRENVIRRITEIEARLDFSAREKVDLVTFESREQVEQGRLALVKAVVEARLALQRAGMSPETITQVEENFRGEWNQRFTQNREQQDRAFFRYRLNNAAGAAAFGGMAGLAGGLVGQQALAEIGRHIPFASELPIVGGLFQKGQTGLEKGIGAAGSLLGHPETAPTPPVNFETFQDLYQNGGTTEIGNHLRAVVGADHSVTFIDTASNQPVPTFSKLTLDPNGHLHTAGELSPSLSRELKQAGFEINRGQDMVEAGRTIAAEKQILGPNGEWTKNATYIESREWYANNTPWSDKTELMFYSFKEGEGVILDISKMGLAYQEGLTPNPIDVQEVIRNHEAVWYFSGPKFPHEGIAVFDGADGTWDGQLHLNPNADPSLHINPADPKSMTLGEFSRMVLNEQVLKGLPDGNIATELYSHQDVFNLGQNGKPGFIEAGRIVDRNGEKVLQAFATIRGTAPMPEAIKILTEIPPKTTLTFEIIPPTPEVFEAPPIIPIPFAPRHPLEPLVIPRPEYPYYNFGYDLFRLPDGRPARLADIIRFRSPDAIRDPRIAPLFQPRVTSPASSDITTPQETTPSMEGRQALTVIHETYLVSPHIYLSLSGAIGDVAINSAYLEGIRQYNERLGQQKHVTLIVPPNIVPLIEPTAKKFGYEVVTEERYQGVDKARSLIAERNENNALVFEFEHHTGRPVVDLLPNGGLVINDLFATSVGLYDNDRAGAERFSEFFSDLLSIPQNQQFNVRPRLELPENNEEVFEGLKRKYSIDTAKKQVAVVVEASHPMKRYSIENWQKILQQLSQGQPNTEFNIIFNPAGGSYTQEQLQTAFGGITGARLVSGNLTEQMTLLAHQNLVLSNDTGLAHVAAILENGPNVISLHIPAFQPNTWVTNQQRHLGVLPPQERLTYDFQSEETDEHKKWINEIQPEQVAQKALEILQTTTPLPEAEPTIRQQPESQRAALETLAAEATIGVEVSPLSLTIGAESLSSIGHSERNEDSFFIDQKLATAGVFDGMGGIRAGQRASQEAMKIVRDRLKLISAADPPNSPGEAEEQIKQALEAANEAVREIPGSGTTASVAQIWTGPAGEKKLVIGHLGDSRVWLLRKDGTLLQLTEDHGLPWVQFHNGVLSLEDYKRVQELLDTTPDASALSSQSDKTYFTHRNEIARHLGMESFECQTAIFDVAPGETVFLTSDGIHDNLTLAEIREILQQPKDPQEIAQLLTKKAQEISQAPYNILKRPKTDDMTAVVMKIAETQVSPKAPVAQESNWISFLPSDIDPNNQIGRYWVAALKTAVNEQRIDNFFTGSRFGEWLVKTLENLGYTVERQDNVQSGTTIITKIEKV